MKKSKTVETYVCDYCGKECGHTPFVVPYKEELFAERDGIRLAKFSERIIAKDVDICSDCQAKMAYVIPSIIKHMEFDLNNPGATVITFGHE